MQPVKGPFSPALLLLLCLPGGTLAPVRQQDPLASRSRGRAGAPVTVYEMADFQCPACRQFFVATLPEIDRDYVKTGKVRWIFINFPLTSIHHNALAAAELAACAARQQKFWTMHDLLYRHQPEWGPLPDPEAYFLGLADSAHLGIDSARACLRSHVALPEIEADAQSARRAGANATPSFYIEGGLLDGAWPAPDFRRILDSIYRVRASTH